VIEDTLVQLSEQLFGLGEKKLLELELPEELYEAVRLAQSLASARARSRQLRLVRRVLRDLEWGPIQERVLTLLEHGRLPARTRPAGESRLEADWVARLVGEGDAGLDAFLQEFARADRTHLRQLVRSIERSSGERRMMAERKLTDTVRSFLASPR
jgi:ribosome-associated protein